MCQEDLEVPGQRQTIGACPSVRQYLESAPALEVGRQTAPGESGLVDQDESDRLSMSAIRHVVQTRRSIVDHAGDAGCGVRAPAGGASDACSS